MNRMTNRNRNMKEKQKNIIKKTGQWSCFFEEKTKK